MSIGDPSLVVCLDAECGNYEQVWCTTSLRGNLVGRAAACACSQKACIRAWAPVSRLRRSESLQQVLARLENPVTGDMLLDELQVTIPPDRRAQIAAAAKVLGTEVAGKIPFAKGVQPCRTIRWSC